MIRDIWLDRMFTVPINNFSLRPEFWAGLSLLFTIILTGCRIPNLPPSIGSGLVTPPASPDLTELARLDRQPAETRGRLAYIASDGNIYVTTADRASTIAVTHDATTFWEGVGLSYQRISWSPDGQLAYASVMRTGDKAKSKLYVAGTVGEPARVIGQSDAHFVIYIYWSPVPCPERPACRQLAYLIEESEDISLHLVEMDGPDLENQIIGLGWPYYFSWAVDGRSILWHTGGSSHENHQARLARYDLEAAATQTLSPAPAAFQAPAWSPQGEHWLGVVSDDQSAVLQLVNDERSRPLATVSKEGATFAWSPDGDQVAYATRVRSDDRFYGPIHLYDLKTGRSKQITDNGLRILAYFWDPAGQRLGYLTLLSMPDAEWMQWRVYDVANDIDRGFKAFNPSPHMEFVMSSFNQYAQSHRFWSPDGRYLVYANRNDEGEDQIWLIDTRSEDSNNAALVDTGTMGFWSWN